jgi:hypothetical protein
MYKCVICDRDLLLEDPYFQLSVDNPYLNIRIHKSCYSPNIKLTEDLLNKIDKYVENNPSKTKKQKKIV